MYFGQDLPHHQLHCPIALDSCREIRKCAHFSLWLDQVPVKSSATSAIFSNSDGLVSSTGIEDWLAWESCSQACKFDGANACRRFDSLHSLGVTWINATYFKLRPGGRIVSVATVIAVGVRLYPFF